MPRNVKTGRRDQPDGASGARVQRDRTRISSKHQVTIREPAFTAAGLHAGDEVQVRALGPGQVVLTRVDELLDRYRGALPPGTYPAGWLQRQRSEWE